MVAVYVMAMMVIGMIMVTINGFISAISGALMIKIMIIILAVVVVVVLMIIIIVGTMIVRIMYKYKFLVEE